MGKYYFNKTLFGIDVMEVLPGEGEQFNRFKCKNSFAITIKHEDLVKKVQELRDKGEDVTVFYRNRGRKRKGYYKADI